LGGRGLKKKREVTVGIREKLEVSGLGGWERQSQCFLKTTIDVKGTRLKGDNWEVTDLNRPKGAEDHSFQRNRQKQSDGKTLVRGWEEMWKEIGRRHHH